MCARRHTQTHRLLPACCYCSLAAGRSFPARLSLANCASWPPAATSIGRLANKRRRLCSQAAGSGLALQVPSSELGVRPHSQPAQSSKAQQADCALRISRRSLHPPLDRLHLPALRTWAQHPFSRAQNAHDRYRADNLLADK